jgi:hypothetical protein
MTSLWIKEKRTRLVTKWLFGIQKYKKERKGKKVKHKKIEKYNLVFKNYNSIIFKIIFIILF